MCAAKFNDFIKEYTDPITDEQKYMEQLVRAHQLLVCSNTSIQLCRRRMRLSAQLHAGRDSQPKAESAGGGDR